MSIRILEKLVEGSNLRILIDTSAIDFYDIVPDFREIAGAKSFYDMPIKDLEQLIAGLELYTRILESDKIVVIPEVRDERERFVNSFDGRYKMIMGIENLTTRRTISKPNNYKRERINYLEYSREDDMYDYEEKDMFVHSSGGSRKRQVTMQESLYKESLRSLKDIQKTLNLKLVVIEDPFLYNELKEAIIELVGVKDLKSKSHPKGRYEYEDIHTDEILIATGIYLAIKNKEQITVATCDSSFGNILRYSSSLLGYVGNGAISQKLREYPVEVCFMPAYRINDNPNKITTNTLKNTQFTYDGIDTGRVQRVVEGLTML